VAFASASNAQEIVASSDAELTQGVIDEIVVTGSRIKRRDFNTLSPLTMIDNEDIAFTGQATIPVSSPCATELTPT
jgi:outer membrane cobalamin receptor